MCDIIKSRDRFLLNIRLSTPHTSSTRINPLLSHFKSTHCSFIPFVRVGRDYSVFDIIKLCARLCNHWNVVLAEKEAPTPPCLVTPWYITPRLSNLDEQFFLFYLLCYTDILNRRSNLRSRSLWFTSACNSRPFSE